MQNENMLIPYQSQILDRKTPQTNRQFNPKDAHISVPCRHDRKEPRRRSSTFCWPRGQRALIGFTVKALKFVWLLAAIGSLTLASRAAETRDEKVLKDKNNVESGGNWIYNDFDRALAEARQTNKPLLITLRCIP